jgi:DNA topoisomerase I
MTELIIAEKPSSAKKIAAALADTAPTKKQIKKVPYYELKHKKKDIIVASAAGHLFTLAEKEKSKGFAYPVFDIKWKASHLANPKGAAYLKDYVATLKALAKECDKFTIACDFDVEGSVIGLNIMRFICKQKDARRMKFSTLTKPDLLKSYAEASPTLDWGQALAGETRHYLDYYYGINVSRALIKAIRTTGSFKILSSGRVQGPALRIVVEREKEIRAFDPVPYWELKLTTKEIEAKAIEADHAVGKFWKEEEAKVAHKNAQVKAATVDGVKSRKFKQAPPTPFDLTTLQTEAYRLFRIKPKETLQHAQSLYIMGVTSYPRTSSQQYPESLEFQKILKDLSSQMLYEELAKILLKLKSLKPNNGKKTDPAHPAIYPTGLVPERMGEREGKIYDLIVKRFMSTFCQAATRETMTISLTAGTEPFVAKGTRTVDAQWHEFYRPYVKIDERELPAVKKGQSLPLKSVDFLSKETQPPKRYTPASLVRELEKQSLGTKATRSEIVDTLYKRNYVIEESITATDLGIQIIDVLEEHVPKIIDPELTRHFDKEMEQIAARKKKGDGVLKEAKKVLTTVLSDFKAQENEIGTTLKNTLEETRRVMSTLGPCPTGDGTLVIKRSKFGQLAGCTNYPDCTTRFGLPKGGQVKPADKQCETCNVPMIKLIRKAKRPQDLCINPECESKATDVKVEEKPCPKCKDGTMILRKSYYGSFLGCNKYPKCKNIEKLE